MMLKVGDKVEVVKLSNDMIYNPSMRWCIGRGGIIRSMHDNTAFVLFDDTGYFIRIEDLHKIEDGPTPMFNKTRIINEPEQGD